MKVLVTGDRKFDNPNPIWAMLTGLYCLDSTNWTAQKREPFVVIEGGQKRYNSDTERMTGADYWAAQWCESTQVSHLHGPVLTPQQWEKQEWNNATNELMFYPDFPLIAQPVVHYQHPADWNAYGKSAGPRRNSLMLTIHPDVDLVLAFHDDLENGSKGTLDMVKKAQEAGVEVWVNGRRLPPLTLL